MFNKTNNVLERIKKHIYSNRTKIGYLFNIIILFFFSCNNKEILPEKTGALNEILIIAEEEKIDKIKKETSVFFEEEVEGLPQKEKKYDAIYIKKKAFSRIFKTHRNIIIIEEGEKDTSFFKKNIWSEDQLVLVIKTNKKTNIKEHINNKNTKKFKEKEKERISKTHTKENSFNIKGTNVKIKTPKEYFIAKDSVDFFWIRKETNEKTYGVWGFSFKGFLENQQTIKKRDSILKTNILGEKKQTYMKTEERYPSFFIEDKNKTQIKGIWKIEGDFMGGPFILNKYYNKEKNETVLIEGFLYYPKEKRNSMLELETILDNIKFN